MATSPENTNQARAAARIGLEEFIEAVTTGVMRAMEAQQDTSGFLQSPAATSIQAGIPGGTLAGPLVRGPWIIGIIYNPAGLPGQVGPAGGQIGG